MAKKKEEAVQEVTSNATPSAVRLHVAYTGALSDFRWYAAGLYAVADLLLAMVEHMVANREASYVDEY